MWPASVGPVAVSHVGVTSAAQPRNCPCSKERGRGEGGEFLASPGSHYRQSRDRICHQTSWIVQSRNGHFRGPEELLADLRSCDTLTRHATPVTSEGGGFLPPASKQAVLQWTPPGVL